MKAQEFFGLALVPALLAALSGAVGASALLSTGASASLSTGAATPAFAYEVTRDESALHDPVRAGPLGGASLLPGSFSLSDGFCPPLPPPTGYVVTVSSEAALRNQAYNAATGTTIMVSAGVYDMQNIVHIVNDGITIRGATGRHGDVILDMGGMGTGHMHGILIDADDVTIADLTIRNVGNHGVSIQGNDRPTLYNLHILDTGEQLVKVNALGTWSEDGLLACSRLEYTTSAPSDYTNGISAHQARNWVVRDNEWYRIRTIDDTPAPTILFWSQSSGTIVERNLLVDCYQGISFGNASHSYIDHTHGIVRNNFIYTSSSSTNDVAIEMVHAQDWLVAHNTVFLLGSPPGLTWGIEARFGDSRGTFAYNLTNKNIWNDRDGALGTLMGNVTNAQSSWFVDAASGDLHLVATATDAIDRATTLANVPDDYDGDARPIGPAPDVGADEYGVPAPTAVTDLRVTAAITRTGTLTATLGWTAPADAVTITLRYSDTLITQANWTSAPLLTDALPGSAETYTATVPYDGSTVYFALKSQNAAGDWSNLSNNAFWPHWGVFLPFVTKGR